MSPLLVIIALSTVSVGADAMLKLSSRGQAIDWRWLLLGCGLYVSTIPAWFFVMRTESLSKIGVAYSISTVLLLVFVDLTFFRGKLTPTEVFAVFLAVVVVVLLRRLA